jgi:betaine-aldehyde dehydrogenase
MLDAIAGRLGEQVDKLAVLEARENGAPVRQAGAFQIGFSIAHLRYFAELARSYAFERTGPLLQVSTLASALVRREPVGVCAAIVPWNFPLLLAMWKIGPALAAGNTIVVKPDEHTPLTLLEFARIAQECGLPPGVLNVVPGDGRVVGARLASHPDVRKIAFTGSTAVGREIMRMAADNVKRLTLELGGHRVRAVRRGLEHRQPAGPRRGRPARVRHGLGQRVAHGQRGLPVRRLQAERARPRTLAARPR